MEFADMGIDEIFVKPMGHTRCSGCDEIVLEMTDNSVMVCSDEFVSRIERKRLPVNFDPSTLPEGMCPECVC